MIRWPTNRVNLIPLVLLGEALLLLAFFAALALAHGLRDFRDVEAIVITACLGLGHGGVTWFIAQLVARGRSWLGVFGVIYGYNAVFIAVLAVVWPGAAIIALVILPFVLCFGASLLKPVRGEHHPYRCTHCGYDLYGTDRTDCPECGQPLTVKQRQMFRALAASDTLDADP